MSDDDLGADSPEEDNEEPTADGDPESAKLKKARLEAVLQKYRATLRNEAEAGTEGFSLDYYKEQKPPHW